MFWKLAHRLEDQKLIKLENDSAVAEPALMDRARTVRIRHAHGTGRTGEETRLRERLTGHGAEVRVRIFPRPRHSPRFMASIIWNSSLLGSFTSTKGRPFGLLLTT